MLAKISRAVVLLGALFAGPLPAVIAQAPSTDTVTKPDSAAVIPVAQPRSAGRPELFAAGNVIVTPALPVNSLLDEDEEAGFGPLRMGVVQDVPRNAAEVGLWTQLADGGWLWTIAVHATDARAVRLRIAGGERAGQGQMVVYDPENPQYALGPLDTRPREKAAEYWTPIVFGPTAHVEFYVAPETALVKPTVAPLAIDGVLNQYRAFPQAGEADGERVLGCHLDPTCLADCTPWCAGVGALSFVSNPYGFFCSGAMLTRIPGDLTPYFMTARHCGVTAANDSSVLVIWFYRSQTCNGNDPPPLGSLPQTPGVVLLVNDSNSDFTLLGMSDANTAGVSFLGWNANYLGDGAACSAWHHPDGSWMRYSNGTKTDDVTSCVGGLSYFVDLPHGSGEVEPGSSGSPLVYSGQIRGTLSCGTWDCDTNDFATYGRFDSAWPFLQPYLIPTDPIYANSAFGGMEYGTIGAPFNTLLEASFAVITGSEVRIQAGNYDEIILINKAMTLDSRNGTATIGQ
jgi:hypothetical protein